VKYLEEYRDAALVRRVLDEIAATVTGEWTLMEICGGQTHSLVRSGLDRMLPPGLNLLHGPGCPVCITPLEMIDRALAIAAREDVIVASYGDMLRVPGTSGDLMGVRSTGADVRVVYSPLDAVTLARENPDREVVFFAIGFETTAPANAMSVLQAERLGLENFSVLVSQATVPAAIRAIMSRPGGRVEAFLAAGHVCTVMGWSEYEPLAEEFSLPIVVTGFEPLDLARGIAAAVHQLEAGRAEVENAYGRAVSREGNREARELIDRVFEPCDRTWRGIGTIAMSGLGLRPEFTRFDAIERFAVSEIDSAESQICIAGEILQGRKKPIDCPAFGTDCTPATPLGATMVSSEGACAAYYRYGRREGAGS